MKLRDLIYQAARTNEQRLEGGKMTTHYDVIEILEAIKEIRKSDCGAWLKDCGSVTFTCADGREKRQELMRLLDKLYKVSKV